MSVRDNEKSEERVQMMNKAEKFSKLYSELEYCTSAEQKQKIEVMNALTDEMSKREFRSVFTEEIFNKIKKMIEEKKFPTENVVLLLKHVGYCNVLNEFMIDGFDYSSLSERFEKMIVEENLKKKEEKNETLIRDLCECCLLLKDGFSSELISIFKSCYPKAALRKEESEEEQKEVEMALLAFCCIDGYCGIDKKLYLKEIREIIQYHQEHNNMTQLSYQLIWYHLIRGLVCHDFDGKILNELHFAGEAKREIEELKRNVDWKRKEDEREKKTEEELLLERWLDMLCEFLDLCESRIEGFVGVLESIFQIFRAAKVNNRDISELCIYLFKAVAENRAVKIDDLLKSGVADEFMEKLQQSTLDNKITSDRFQFFESLSTRLKEEKKDKMEEVERKAAKRKAFEKMEEEGYEDIIISFHGMFDFLYRKCNSYLSSNIFNYFVFI
ncbi:uncharacterized protein MONOS_14238 [Monocercomonoides exilis]|uniref:uncharacterized protein n=1 Tax=Monocercomonoides exilis TaxID=2049356 RepID=UPI0035594AE9|nr:hypothetical protein MONOS_14238 [Monocercomonoides exilis]|eukprot:MONOS_14238.1-p1 / transcript=MONOS_14238.1 / gene=MONOS_14238 / organism=Monocercomonoides_exilis_PA203 / gene_product=unspecified product / transcript_product=unspecified product / location=Mono_scaffold00961:5586-7040(-) / protein_length=442 / sequence_SO=supercontig / SO=protein_coding / is_pseudo=false